MMVPAAGLPEIVALFHLHTLQAVPLSDGGPVWVATMDLGETGALAVALRIYAQQAGNAAARSGSRKNPYFVAISQEDQYDRTL